MIERSEIERKAQEFSVTIPSVQRDYAVGWFLVGLFSTSAYRGEYFLKGGNADVRARYLTARQQENWRANQGLIHGKRVGVSQAISRQLADSKAVSRPILSQPTSPLA